MKLRIIKKKTITLYSLANAGSRPSFEEFLEKLKQADWEKPTDMRETFNSADILGKGSNRVVFNIGGNNYRLIAKYTFGEKRVHLFICWIGTHAEYTRLCYNERQYAVTLY